MTDYSQYLPYADERQKQIVNAMLEGGTQRKAAEILGVNRSNVSRGLDVLRKKAEKAGYNPELGFDHPSIQKTSTLVKGGKEDDYVMRWIKANATSDQRVESLVDVLSKFEWKPAPAIKAPKKTNNSLLSLYTLTDFHLGMYSWAKETGDDWDINIAREVMQNAIDDMASASPDSEVCLLNIQGDFFHYDSIDSVTPTSGHIVDADTRFDLMFEMGLDLIMWSVERLLKKHKTVRVIIVEGNHDISTSKCLRIALKKIYSANPRLEIDDTVMPYYAYQFGQTMLGFHHGHKKKNSSLASLFSSEPRYRSMWGSSVYCYIHTGHYHHNELMISEHDGCLTRRHPTLAGRDAHAARGGYISQRGAKLIVYDKNGNETSEFTVTPRI